MYIPNSMSAKSSNSSLRKAQYWKYRIYNSLFASILNKYLFTRENNYEVDQISLLHRPVLMPASVAS